MTPSTLQLSVIIPVYNGEHYIKTAVESVIGQRGCQFELIIVNDGSTDGTATTLKPYRHLLRYFYQDNAGVSQARNFGVEQSYGKYIAFLDADDYFLPGKLAAQLAIFHGDPQLGIVHSGWQRVDAHGNLIDEVAPWKTCPTLDLVSWLEHKPVLPSAMMFRRELLLQVGGFDTKLAAAEDVDLVLRLAIAGCQSRWLKKCTTAYRQHGQSAMGDGLAQANCLDIMLDKTFNHPQLPDEARVIEFRIRYGTLIWAAWYLYRTGYLREMADRLMQAYAIHRQLPTISLCEWIESFSTFSRASNETLDVKTLVNSRAWQALQDRLILVSKNEQAPQIILECLNKG